MDMKAGSHYDVIIIGAGPAGIYASLKLREVGFKVLVVEEDKEIGKPRFCTGLISKEAFDEFGLPTGAIENEFSSAWVFSPLGSKMQLKAKGMRIYATNRTLFDQSLFCLAKNKGVEFILGSHCCGLALKEDYALAKITTGDKREADLRAEVVVLATGIKYNLHRQIGLVGPGMFLDCSQVQLPGVSKGEIEIFVGNEVAPRSFAWVVPLKENKLRIGLSTYQDSKNYLQSFLKNLRKRGYISDGKCADIIRRPIPLGAIKNTYFQRALVVGDAAGQVKPMTGGGVYFGLLCADIAAKTIIEAFKRRDFSAHFLRRYEIGWKKRIEFDLTMGLYLRKLVANLNDRQLEKLIQFCGQEDVQEMIRKYADFNHHGRFIKELIKRPIFWRNLYHILAATTG